MSKASCRTCRGEFDVTYCRHTRRGMCPSCAQRRAWQTGIWAATDICVVHEAGADYAKASKEAA